MDEDGRSCQDMNNLPLMEFLEAALQDTLEANPKKVVIAYLDEDGSTHISYCRCSYEDLQHMGMELINEGTMRLIANNEDRMQELKDEDETEEE